MPGVTAGGTEIENSITNILITFYVRYPTLFYINVILYTKPGIAAGGTEIDRSLRDILKRQCPNMFHT